jgi:outer membrane protein TolC
VRSAVVAIIAALVVLSAMAIHASAADRKAESSEDAAQRVKLQKERVEVLTRLVAVDGAQYRTGVIPCEDLIGAETDLLNAQCDAAGKPEERVALLTEGLKRETDLLKLAEAHVEAGIASQADVHRARSLLLATRIRLLREGDGKGNAAAQIKGLQKERIQALSRLVAVYMGQYREGRVTIEPVFAAQNDITDAEVEAADKPAERVALLTAALKRATEFEKTIENRLKAGRANPADLEWARSISLYIQIRLSSEQTGTAAQIKELQKKRIETLTRVVARYERLYQTGQSDFEPVFDVQTELASARLEATDKHEERVALLTELVKGASERLRVTDDKYKAAMVGDVAPLQARSLLLDAKIRLLRERSMEATKRR